MAITESIPSSIVTRGDPITYYEIALNEDGTHRLSLRKDSRCWILKSITMKKYLDFKNEEHLSEIQCHEILTAHLYGGEIHVRIITNTFQKSSFKKWEREIINDVKLRDVCSLFGIIPEDLDWPEQYTPSYVYEPTWKEPIQIEFISLSDQAEAIAEKIRRIHTLQKYLKTNFPEFDDIADTALFYARNEMNDLLSFREISSYTDPEEIPKWAWHDRGYQCKKRKHQALSKKYKLEGLIE